tara:strand:- start:195 stop:509 length:315 start_codon:yes stop_codon:yes gene_type:complete
MDYKSKYIKYKLKYLKLGGMGTLKRHEPTTERPIPNNNPLEIIYRHINAFRDYMDTLLFASREHPIGLDILNEAINEERQQGITTLAEIASQQQNTNQDISSQK